MKRTWTCLPLAIAGALALGACTGDATRSDVTYDEPEPRATAPAPEPKVATTAPSTTPAPTAPALPAPDVGDDELVGVEACDDYLESYRSCHRVAAIYPPETIDGRYEQLRARLVAEGRDPANHEGLRLQCESLGADLKTTLDGRDCPDEPEIADLEDDADDTSLEDAVGDGKDRP